MNTTTNPAQGVEDGSINSAVAKLLGPDQEDQHLDEVELERENPDEETLEVDDNDEEVIEDSDDDEEVEDESDESEVGDQEVVDNSDEGEEEPYHSITYNGEEYEVTLDELKKGYQLQKDYTQKTQVLSEERTQVDTLKQQLESERQKYIQINQEILSQQQHALQAFDSVDWAELKATDPMGYMEKVAEKQEAERQFTEQQAKAERALTEQQAEANQRLQSYLQEQSVIVAQAIPEYSDPEQGEVFRNSIAQYARESGYADQEIQSIADARDLIVLNKARLYDELQAKRQEVRKKKGKAKPSVRIKSSSPQGNVTKKTKAIEAKKQKLARSGRTQDAESLLFDLMTQPKKKKR